MAEEEDELDEAIDEQRQWILARRALYKQVQCNAMGWSEVEGMFNLIFYRDATEKIYYVKLDTGLVRRLRKWCDKFLVKNEEMLEGYQ
jgi:hypothetical protein